MIITDVLNVCVSLLTLHHYAEARSLLREHLPIARRVMGRDDPVTFTMTETLAQSLFQQGAAPRDDMLEAAEIFTEHLQRLRQVLESAHPITQRVKRNLERIRECLARF